MELFDDEDENRKKRRNPFDDFGIDDDFIKDIFNDDRMMDDVRRMAEEMMKMFSNAQPGGKPYVHGFKVGFGPDGKPHIEDFGNRSIKTPNGAPKISEEREPLTDIIEGDLDVAVTVEIPGVEKSDIDLNVTNDTLEIKVDAAQRKYQKNVNLPCDVKPNTTKATYKNGILDVVIKRKEKKKPGDGYKVNIE